MATDKNSHQILNTTVRKKKKIAGVHHFIMALKGYNQLQNIKLRQKRNNFPNLVTPLYWDVLCPNVSMDLRWTVCFCPSFWAPLFLVSMAAHSVVSVGEIWREAVMQLDWEPGLMDKLRDWISADLMELRSSAMAALQLAWCSWRAWWWSIHVFRQGISSSSDMLGIWWWVVSMSWRCLSFCCSVW